MPRGLSPTINTYRPVFIILVLAQSKCSIHCSGNPIFLQVIQTKDHDYTQVSEIQVLLTYMFPLHISNGRYMHIDLKNPIRCSKKTFISLPPSYHRFILWYYPLQNLQFFFLCPLFASHAPELLHLKCDCVTIKIQVANSFNSQLSLGKNIKLEAIRTTDCERQIDN